MVVVVAWRVRGLIGVRSRLDPQPTKPEVTKHWGVVYGGVQRRAA